MSKTQLKTLTLSSWSEQYGKDRANGLYAVNNAKQSMDIVFNVKDHSGAASAVMIPATYVPVDLTSFATIDSLMNSPDFRRLINNQIIVIVDNKQIEDLRANDPQIARAMAEVTSSGTETAVNATGTIEIKGSTAPAATQPVQVDEDEISAVEAILEVSEDPSVTQSQLQDVFLRYRNNLTEEEKDELLHRSRNDNLISLLSEVM